MVNVTLFELHLEGSEFTANAPYSGEEPDADVGEGVSVEGAKDGAGGPPVGLLAVLAVVLAVVSAVAAKKMLDGSEDDAE